MTTDVVIPQRFHGPPRSGNGGYTAGLLAQALAGVGGPPVAVSLRVPPPLDTPLSVTREEGSAVLADGDVVVATAEIVGVDLAVVPPVGPEAALAASAGYPGLRSHPFPTCFACGTERPDGLRIFPGPVTGSDGDGPIVVAAPWTPAAELADPASGGDGERVDAPVAWAALDCVGGWAGDQTDRLMVLGRMTAELDALPVAGEPHVVMGRRTGGEGRKTWTEATLYDADGRIVGRAAHVWIAVDPRAFD